MGNNKITDDVKCRQIAGNFDCHAHADAAVWCRAHCLMEHIPGFTRSHWMPPSVEWLHHIAVAAAMVDNFGQKHKTLTKIYM